MSATMDRLRRREEVPTTLRLQVELIYDPGCPNVAAARTVLSDALRATGLPAVWTEWSTADPDCPAERRGFGSPTILVNEGDVAPGPHPWVRREEGDGPRCRVYRSDDGTPRGAPPVERVVEALQEVMGPDAV